MSDQLMLFEIQRAEILCHPEDGADCVSQEGTVYGAHLPEDHPDEALLQTIQEVKTATGLPVLVGP